MRKNIAIKELVLGSKKIKVELVDNNRAGWKGTVCRIYEPWWLPFFKWKKTYETEVVGIRTNLVSIIKEAVFRYLYEEEVNNKTLKELNTI
jgi:hypothetical protein